MFVFKDKMSDRSHKTVEIKVFLTFLACQGKDPDQIQVRNRIRIHNTGSEHDLLAFYPGLYRYGTCFPTNTSNVIRYFLLLIRVFGPVN
jgi:hypothetical protein